MRFIEYPLWGLCHGLLRRPGRRLLRHKSCRILTPPVRLLGFLDRSGKFGLPIQTTEFDSDTNDEHLQADYLRDYMKVTFSHPAVSGFVLWGF